MENVKLIASDLDHTLLTEKGELPPGFDRYVIEMDKRGIEFVAASGRPLYTLETIFQRLRGRMSFIADNGGIISHRGRAIFKSLLDVADYRAMVRFTNERTDGIAVVCGLDAAYLSAKHKTYEGYLRTFYSKIAFVDGLERLDVEADKFTVYFPNRNSKDNYENIFKPEYGGGFSVTVGDTVWIDIMRHGINKGAAIRLLGEHLGLGPDRMMAFGDTYNDIEMLQAVRYSYVVGNADADMRRHAAFIADTNDNFGVIKIIDKVLWRRSRQLAISN